MDDWGELVRILALESVRNQVVVIGEDLGTVEPFIREALQRFGVLSYRLLYFEKDGAEFRNPKDIRMNPGLGEYARSPDAGRLLAEQRY